MFECGICGLLSLNAISCPACGSQNLKDLSVSEAENSDLPIEIPGLDDAVNSWREIDGNDDESVDEKLEHSRPDTKTLPFGYSGESNFQVSRLPFGIGSQAEGIPFDNEIVSVDDGFNQPADSDTVFATDIAPQEPEGIADKPLLEVVIKRPEPIRIQPLPEDNNEPQDGSQSDSELPTEFEQPSENVDDIPEEWRISASEVNMAEIYSTEQEFVEVIHQHEEDVVVFDHADNQSVGASQLVLDDDVNILSLELHPARALDVDISMPPRMPR